MNANKVQLICDMRKLRDDIDKYLTPPHAHDLEHGDIELLIILSVLTAFLSVNPAVKESSTTSKHSQECELCHNEFPIREVEMGESGQLLCVKCGEQKGAK